MKVLLHYEDNDNSDLHKSLKITLPKSWKTGPVSQLLEQFVESYNPKFDSNQLQVTDCHISMRQKISETSDKTELVPIASDAVVIDAIPDRADVYICHGASFTMEEKKKEEEAKIAAHKAELANTVACTHFGCKKRFPKGGPYPECTYHKLPPVFHETAKYWACCPNKKAYDWDDFQNIPGCCTGSCTDVKDDGKQFLGGTDLREQASEGQQLKSIDDFNKSMASGGAEAAPVLDRLQKVLGELGVEKELFDQVIEGYKKEMSGSSMSDPELLEAIAKELGGKLKSAMKSIAAEQLRIN